jgi:simple sugar transport system ATP-binding protein
MQPTRGLDPEATRFVYEQMREATGRGMGVLLFSLDLDEIFEVSDKIAVMFNGVLAGMLPRVEATPEAIGRMMVEGAA